jgi:biotin operon repressor
MTHDTTGTARQRKPDSAKIKIKGSWTAIPNKLLKDHRLSRDARLLGCLIFMHAANSGRAFPSQEKMAEELGCTRRSIIRWLEELQLIGWVEWQHTIRNNAYTINDPDETLADVPLSQPNDESTVTPVSHHVIAVSHPHATQRSHGVTQESHSHVTQRSIHVTQESLSYNTDSYNTDSYNTDSSSSDIPPAHSDDDADDAVVAYLRSLGVSTAQEFAGLDLAAVRARVAHIQRDPNWRPGAIVKSLRTQPPSPAPATDSRAYLAQLNATYGDLFRAGSDTSDLDDVPALEQEAGRD